jgi:hypothetical protein
MCPPQMLLKCLNRDLSIGIERQQRCRNSMHLAAKLPATRERFNRWSVHTWFPDF